MPGLLQPRLSCFYCGNRSPYAKDGKTRQFTCHVCEATNHLDHKGDITDPPSTPAKAQTLTFAQSRPKATSPTTGLGDSGDNSLFCKTCLKNQHLLTTCLAEYLPAEDDPQYAKYERQYPQYRKDLERRYPQVCPRCAPRAQERIQKTGYAARIDFLTRSLERSKAFPVSSVPTTKRLAAFAFNLATLAWWASMMIQVLWHTSAVLGLATDSAEIEDMNPLQLIGCSVTAILVGRLPSGCAHLLKHSVGQALQLSLFLVWWNPALKARLLSTARSHQWQGLAEFYTLQLLVYVGRFTAWWTLKQSHPDPSVSTHVRAVHGVALVGITLSIVASYRIVTCSSAPKLSFKDNNAPLVDPDAFHYPSDDISGAQSSSRPPVSSLRPSPPRPFNIATLGPRRDFESTGRFSPAADPPAPPPQSLYTAQFNSMDDDPDSMDWEPLPRTAQPLLKRTHNPLLAPSMTHDQQLPASNIPAFLRAPATASAGQKSPFTGRLPPAPISPAHRLRNPPPPPQFKPTPLSKQQDFFKKMGLSSAALPLQSTGSAKPRRRTGRAPLSDDEDDEASTYSPSYVQTDTGSDVFRPAQWTLKSDLDAATKGTGTGLEDMFNTSFKLADDTPSQTPRRNRHHNVGGDGREVFESKSFQAAATTARFSHARLVMYILPILLAGLVYLLAVVQYPSTLPWVFNTLRTALAHVGFGFDRRTDAVPHSLQDYE